MKTTQEKINDINDILQALTEGVQPDYIGRVPSVTDLLTTRAELEEELAQEAGWLAERMT